MIVDPEQPDAPTRRWPFLIGWSLAAAAILGWFLLAQVQTPAYPSGPVSGLTTPAATAAGATSATYRPVSVVSRRPNGERPTFPSPSSYSEDGGVLSYLDYSGQRIAIGLHDDLISGDPPSD